MLLYVDNHPFIAIIGDIRSSRQLESRKIVQEKLKVILEGVNKKYEKDITARFVITLGDEFQGLLSDGKNIIKIIEEIKMQLYPVEVRFGIGIGKITTDINTEMALGADGPGYYMARQAIEKLKENEKKNKTVMADIRLKAEEDSGKRILLMNTAFELIKAIEQNWTDRQREIIWDMLQHQDGQKKTAFRMGIAQSSVHKALTKGRYYVYEKSLKNLECILGEINL